MHDSDESVDVQEDSDYESMPKDDLRSVAGSEDTDSDNTQGNDVSHSDHIFQDDNASAERLSLPNHMDHICEEVSSLHSKLGDMESSIIHQVLAAIKSSLPALVTTALQEQLPGLLSATLKDCLPSILQESLLLESAVIIDDTAEGEKNKKAKDANPAATQGEQQSAELLVESQGEQPTDVKVANKESAPPASDNKSGEGKELIICSSLKNNKSPYNNSLTSCLKPLPQGSHQLFPKNQHLPEIPLKAKQSPLWKNQAKRLGLPPPPELATFGLIAEEKKRKRTEFIKQVFLTRDVRVDGIDMNLIPPTLVLPIQGLVINEPELEIFFISGNTEIGFQREKIKLSIGEPLSGGLRGKEDQPSAKHQLAVKGLSECTASESNIRRIQVKDILKEFKDYLKTYSSAGMYINWVRSDHRDNQGRGSLQSKSKGKGTYKLKCYICYSEDHLEKDCPKRNKKKSTGFVKKNVGQGSGMHSEGFDNGDLLMAVSEERFLEWIMDSGGSFYMTPRRDFFFDFKEFNGGTVLLGDNRACVIRGTRKVRVQMKDGSTLHREGYTVKLQNGRVKVIKGSLMVLSGTMKGNCVCSLDGWAESGEASISIQEKESLAQVWHKRLGHISEACLHELEKREVLRNKGLGKLESCKNCVLGKSTRVSFGRGQHTTEGVID
ncbi:retrovirus-related pol polyprotein from transposon TNT 1-94 [Tanacetum coccineum]